MVGGENIARAIRSEIGFLSGIDCHLSAQAKKKTYMSAFAIAKHICPLVNNLSFAFVGD